MRSFCQSEIDFDKCGGWNKRGGWNIFMKSIIVEGDFFLWRVEFFKIGKHDVTFIREMRVPPDWHQTGTGT